MRIAIFGFKNLHCVKFKKFKFTSLVVLQTKFLKVNAFSRNAEK